MDDINPGSQPSDTLEPEPVPERPRRFAGDGRVHRNWLIALAVVLMIVSVVFIVLAMLTFSERSKAAADIDAATSFLETADVVVVKVDGVMRSEITSALAGDARSALSALPQAQVDLNEAIRLLGQAKQRGAEDDVKRAELMEDTAESRIAMLDQAEEVLPFNIKASESLQPATEGWALVLAADKASDEAVASYNKLTKAGVTASSTLNKQAAESLASALARFKEAEQAFPEVAFESYIAYIEARIELNKLSQQSDTAWLKGDLNGANRLIGQYNAADKRAVELAKTLPATPERAIAEAYEKQAKAATDAYYEARDEATAADKRLREF